MQKKSLGRGLEDISSTFLSNQKNKKDKKDGKKKLRGFSANSKREDTCSSCINLNPQTDGTYKCKIFSLEYEKFGVPQLESITLEHAKFCEYFDNQPLRSSSAISSSETVSAMNSLPETESFENKSLGAEIEDFEIKEAAIIHKNIAISQRQDSQERIKEILFQHLGNSYDIVRIELRKKTEVLDENKKKTQEEHLSIFIESGSFPQ